MSPRGVQEGIPIPPSAAGQFRRPVPVGPMSLYQRAAGVYRAPAGSISLRTGELTPSGGWLADARGQVIPDGVDAGFRAATGLGISLATND